MLTLTYGLKRPEDGDKGQTIFNALEDNIVQLDNHSHNGSNSPKLPAASLTKTTQTITNAGWSLVANGIYKQNVSITGVLAYDSYSIEFRDTSDNSKINLKTIKTATAAYDVYCNDNTMNLLAIYS